MGRDELKKTNLKNPLIITPTCSEADLIIIQKNLGEFAKNIIQLENYVSSGLISLHMKEIAEINEVNSIIALSEIDVMRAAQLRGALGLTGMNAEDALYFRDKSLMKAKAVDAGITCVPHALVYDPLTLIDKAKEIGFPVVVKPPMGRGSSGVQIIRSEDSLRTFLATYQWNDLGVQIPLLLEGFIEGDLCRVDGVIHNGNMKLITAARYWGSHLDYLDGGCLGSIMLEPESFTARNLIQLTEKLLFEVLPFGMSGGFHVEIFETENGSLVFNEAASRLGGGSIMEEIVCAYGVNIKTLTVAAEAGQDTAVDALIKEKNAQFVNAAQLHISPRSQKLEYIPDTCPDPRVVLYEPMGRAGTNYSLMTHTNSEIARFVLKGPDETSLSRSLNEIFHWFETEVCWSTKT